jgi:hypothetical protein
MSVQRDIFEIEVQLSQHQEYSTRQWVLGIDNLNALSMWEMLRTLAKLSPSKRNEVVEQARRILAEQRGWQAAYQRIQWAADIVGEMRFKAPPAGLFTVRPGLRESDEETDANVFLQERRAGTRSELITLKQPSMALNAGGISPRYHMQFTATISAHQSAQDIIDLVANKGHLKHLAISCHGRVSSADGATTLELGSNFDSSSVGLFTQLSGKVGVIWIGGCLAGETEKGNNDCINRAKNAGCHVVAPAFLMATRGGDLPLGRMDMNRRFMPRVYKPSGDLIDWDSFLRMGKLLEFTVA